MQNKYVIDSNIFIKIFIDEDDSPQAKAFFLHCLKEGIVLLVPSIFTYEILYIAQKKGHSIEAVREHLNKNKQIQVVELSNRLMNKSVDIINKTSHPKSGFPSFYDASYHALAMLNDCDFITADKRHYEKTKELGNIKLLAEMT